MLKKGYRIKVAVRRPELCGHLQTSGVAGQIQFVQSNLRYPESVDRAIVGSDIVINSIGLLFEKGGQNFDNIHKHGPGLIANLCAKNKVKKLIHISAIGSDITSKSKYARTKAEGEHELLEEKKDSIIVRPSVIYGPEDNFFNQFAKIISISPLFPLFGGGDTKFQPVYVVDLANAILNIIEDNKGKQIFEIGGNEIYSFKEIIEFISLTIKKRRILLPIPFNVSRFVAFFMMMLPRPLLTPDQVELLKYDNVVDITSSNIGRLEDLDIVPNSIETIVPAYIERFCNGGKYKS
ncbi:MAG: NADH dehydrogenase [Alphaproteobacteria bacterium]